MPAKITTICYVYSYKERITEKFTIKEIVGVSRLDENDPEKVAYLQIKAFIPLDSAIECQIKPFELEDVIYLKGKFVTCPNYYKVCFTSQKRRKFNLLITFHSTLQ